MFSTLCLLGATFAGGAAHPLNGNPSAASKTLSTAEITSSGNLVTSVSHKAKVGQYAALEPNAVMLRRHDGFDGDSKGPQTNATSMMELQASGMVADVEAPAISHAITSQHQKEYTMSWIPGLESHTSADTSEDVAEDVHEDNRLLLQNQIFSSSNHHSLDMCDCSGDQVGYDACLATLDTYNNSGLVCSGGANNSNSSVDSEQFKKRSSEDPAFVCSFMDDVGKCLTKHSCWTNKTSTECVKSLPKVEENSGEKCDADCGTTSSSSPSAGPKKSGCEGSPGRAGALTAIFFFFSLG